MFIASVIAPMYSPMPAMYSAIISWYRCIWYCGYRVCICCCSLASSAREFFVVSPRSSRHAAIALYAFSVPS